MTPSQKISTKSDKTRMVGNVNKGHTRFFFEVKFTNWTKTTPKKALSYTRVHNFFSYVTFV